MLFYKMYSLFPLNYRENKLFLILKYGVYSMLRSPFFSGKIPVIRVLAASCVPPDRILGGIL